jgi:cytoskeleton protein RodZ
MTEGVRGEHSAGSMLRAARERQGLHIAALAAAIKVAPRKLDALENDRWDELPDATFTRALAQTVCRTLKIDPSPVLAQLPSTDPGLLDTVSGTLNTPFDARGARGDGSSASAVRQMVLGGVLLLLAAVAVYVLPAGFWPGGERIPVQAGLPAAPVVSAVQVAPTASQPVDSGVVVAAAEPASAAAGPGADAVAQIPIPSALPVASAAAAASSAPAVVAPVTAAAASAVSKPLSGDGPVRVLARQATWISARDVHGTTLVSRLLDAGESIAVGGDMPLRLTIGNAAGTELAFRGQKVDLAPSTRDNVARVELQ